MFMLLHLNEDFDDDMLQEVILLILPEWLTSVNNFLFNIAKVV